MFPNVRLMAVAILASIVAMSCGLGAFAALRVNRDSLARLPAAGPPLQLAFNAAPTAVTSATPAPFGVRFAVLAPRVAGAAAVDAEISSPDQPNREAAREVKTNTAALTETEPTADDFLPADVAPPSPEAKPDVAKPDVAKPDVAKPDMAKLDTAKPDRAEPESKSPAAAKAAGTVTHKASRRRRLAAAIHRSRKAQAIAAAAPSADQNSGFSDPNFQFGSNVSPPQPAKSRVVRTAAKAAAATSAVGGPFVRPKTQ